MKKFIMTSPYQPEGRLQKQVYKAQDNSKLQYNKAISFPILSVINGYACKDENIEVYIILSNYENAKHNLEIFKRELSELCEEKNITYNLKIIDIPYNNLLDTQLETFQKLIEVVEDNDTLYACMTYGSKTVPLIENMALNYAYRLKNNVSIGCIVYGGIDFNTNKSLIYDITSLFYMDEIVRLLAEQKVANPQEKIRLLLDM